MSRFRELLKLAFPVDPAEHEVMRIETMDDAQLLTRIGRMGQEKLHTFIGIMESRAFPHLQNPKALINAARQKLQGLGY